MGKTRGHGTRKGGAASGRSRGGRGGGRPAKDGAASDFESESDSDSGKEQVMKVKKPGGQPSTAGMMPTDSDSEEEEAPRQQPPAKPAAQPPAQPPARRQPQRKAAANGESSSGSEESSSGETETDSSSGESETESDDDGPSAHRPPAFMDPSRRPPPAGKGKANSAPQTAMPAVESDETIQARKDMERLALIREKREQQRLERVAKEGRDRYAAEPKH